MVWRFFNDLHYTYEGKNKNDMYTLTRKTDSSFRPHADSSIKKVQYSLNRSHLISNKISHLDMSYSQDDARWADSFFQL